MAKNIFKDGSSCMETQLILAVNETDETAEKVQDCIDAAEGEYAAIWEAHADGKAFIPNSTKQEIVAKAARGIIAEVMGREPAMDDFMQVMTIVAYVMKESGIFLPNFYVVSTVDSLIENGAIGRLLRKMTASNSSVPKLDLNIYCPFAKDNTPQKSKLDYGRYAQDWMVEAGITARIDGVIARMDSDGVYHLLSNQQDVADMVLAGEGRFKTSEAEEIVARIYSKQNKLDVYKSAKHDPWLQPVANGVLDLKAFAEGEDEFFFSFDEMRGRLLQNRLFASFDPDAQSDGLDEILNSWTRVSENDATRDPNKLLLLEEILGIIIWQGSSHVNLRAIPFLFGPKHSAKSTCVEAIVYLLEGDRPAEECENYAAVQADQLTDPTTMLDVIPGRQMLLFDDIPVGLLGAIGRNGVDNSKSAASVLKKLGSCNPIRFRAIYSRSLEINPKATLVMASNDLPSFSRADADAMADRLCLLEFAAKFDSATENKTLEHDLQTPFMASCLLNHALAGFKRLYNNNWNFTHVESSSEAKQEMREGSDSVLEWINANNITAEALCEDAHYTKRTNRLHPRKQCCEAKVGRDGWQPNEGLLLLNNRLWRYAVADEVYLEDDLTLHASTQSAYKDYFEWCEKNGRRAVRANGASSFTTGVKNHLGLKTVRKKVVPPPFKTNEDKEKAEDYARDYPLFVAFATEKHPDKNLYYFYRRD